MQNLLIHTIQLFLHFGNLLLPGALVTLEFLDLVVQDVPELLEFLLLLLEFVDSVRFFLDGGLSLLDVESRLFFLLVETEKIVCFGVD